VVLCVVCETQCRQRKTGQQCQHCMAELECVCRYEESPDGALVRQVAPAPIPEGPSSSSSTTAGGTSWSRSHSQRLVPKTNDTPGTPLHTAGLEKPGHRARALIRPCMLSRVPVPPAAEPAASPAQASTMRTLEGDLEMAVLREHSSAAATTCSWA
jgi:hypothetical protein